ncbi:hypothetical protein [Methylobacter sp.]|uniref:hypothetical protein n=1 Tax=Methylobacter sp. TaxID=2051955 RepID=UPI003DA4E785
MPEQPSTPVHIELAKLHATICLSMTHFINGRHGPKLAHSIVHQLSLLLAHPDLERIPSSRELYQQLLDHWQKVTARLLEQQSAHEPRPIYH